MKVKSETFHNPNGTTRKEFGSGRCTAVLDGRYVRVYRRGIPFSFEPELDRKMSKSFKTEAAAQKYFNKF